jgi:hypothetical protein
MIKRKVPHRCPVCNGTGLVPNGFYRAIGVDSWSTADTTPETCRSCNETGIVYGEETDTNGFRINYEAVEDEIQFY